MVPRCLAATSLDGGCAKHTTLSTRSWESRASTATSGRQDGGPGLQMDDAAESFVGFRSTRAFRRELNHLHSIRFGSASHVQTGSTRPAVRRLRRANTRRSETWQKQRQANHHQPAANGTRRGGSGGGAADQEWALNSAASTYRGRGTREKRRERMVI